MSVIDLEATEIMAVINLEATEEWKASICEKLGIDPSDTQRIVIDIQPHSAVMVYVGMYAPKSLLEAGFTDLSLAIEDKTK